MCIIVTYHACLSLNIMTCHQPFRRGVTNLLEKDLSTYTFILNKADSRMFLCHMFVSVFLRGKYGITNITLQPMPHTPHTLAFSLACLQVVMFQLFLHSKYLITQWAGEHFEVASKSRLFVLISLKFLA